MQLAQRVGEILHLDQVDMLERAGRRFGQHAAFLRAVPRRGDQRAGPEGHCRAHDRADIVRVGHLVEHHDQPVSPSAASALGLQRPRLDQHALMHRVAAGDLVDVARLDDFGLEGQGGEVGDVEPLQRVAGHQHAADFAARIVERGAHRVEAVEPDQAVRRGLAGRHRLARRGTAGAWAPLFWSR